MIRLKRMLHDAFVIIGYLMQTMSVNEPLVGPDGPTNEKNKVLVDEFHPKYVRLDNHDLIAHC